MGHKLDNVIGLYVHGVWDGHLDAAIDKFIGDAPTAATRAGEVGSRFRAAYEPLVSRYDRRFVQPVRGFEDGSKVMLHSFQSFGYQSVQQVRIDIFDTDAADMIIDWWTAVTPLAPVNRNGRSQIDGPTFVEDVAATADNKRIVRSYLSASGDSGYVCPDSFDQHGTGLVGVPAAGSVSARGMVSAYTDAQQFAGCGNYVAVYSHRQPVCGGAEAVCDLYRLDHGHIVEHWDTVQAL